MPKKKDDTCQLRDGLWEKLQRTGSSMAWVAAACLPSAVREEHQVEPLWRSALGKAVLHLASAAWPTCGGEGFVCNSAYTNALSYGDSMFQHQDATSLTKYIDRDVFVTALIYPNPSWHVDWGGETVFYDGEHA